ncbi:MAG TPA: hypothetical protein VHT53_08360 [Candidatus Elarobacter sp.]|nr:hypothetical protein [Candidatus Elarobacter sp.]
MMILVLAVCNGRPAAAESSAADAIPVVRAAQPPPLGPALADPAWQAGRIGVKPAFVDLTTRRAAPVATTVYLLYDDRALYVGFHAEQPGVAIVAGQTTNGVGFGIDDFVGVGIDPGGSGSQVYYFEATPRGTRYQQASENARYAPAWNAAGRVEGAAWDVTMEIPLAALRLHRGPQRWRLNFVRGIAATGEHLTWAFDGVMSDGPIGTGWPNFADVRFWPSLRPFTLANAGGASRTPRADVYALGSAGRDRTLFQQADQSFAPERIRALGVDFAAPITDTITFVGTLAPDFSNVEIDQQTIAPQEFRRALTEYRPFFAQGASFLNPDPNPAGAVSAPPNLAFYSPSIGPFDRGAKVEGTHGNDSFGLLSVRGYDEIGGDVFDDVAYGFKHALPDATFMYWADGVLAHHSTVGSDETTEAGVKGRSLRTGFVWELDDAVEHGTALDGVAHSLHGYVDVHKPNYEMYAGYLDIAPHFDPLDGFTATSDIRGPSFAINLLGNGTRVKSWVVSLLGDRFLDASGAVHEADALALLGATFKNGFSLNGFGPQTGVLRAYDVPAGPGCAGPAIARTFFTGAPCYRNGRTERFDLFNAGFGYRDGTPAPFDWSYAWGPFGGMELHQFTSTTSRPLAGRFALTLEYDGTWERSQATGRIDSQFLRRVGIGHSLGRDANVSIALRTINGDGGFALPGTNVAATFHRHWANGDELYVDYGTPAATATLNRLIVKFVFHAGPLPGT